MTKQERLYKEKLDKQKRLRLQSRYLRKTGERVAVPQSQPRLNPFRNEKDIYTLKKEQQDLQK